MNTLRTSPLLSAALTLMIALASSLLPTSALAVSACVNTSTALEQALADASDSADDDIRLQTGNYQLSGEFPSLRGDVRISGGWSVGCTSQIPLNTFSQINGPGATILRKS